MLCTPFTWCLHFFFQSDAQIKQYFALSSLNRSTLTSSRTLWLEILYSETQRKNGFLATLQKTPLYLHNYMKESFILISGPLFFKATLAWILFLKPGTAPKGSFTMWFCDHLQCVLSSASESRAHVWWCDCCSAGICPNWVIFLWQGSQARQIPCSAPSQLSQSCGYLLKYRLLLFGHWVLRSGILFSCFVILPYFWNHSWLCQF